VKRKDPIEKIMDEMAQLTVDWIRQEQEKEKAKEAQANEFKDAITLLMRNARQVYLSALDEGFTEKMAAKMTMEIVTAPFKGASQ
jgi:hypothetical protein